MALWKLKWNVIHLFEEKNISCYYVIEGGWSFVTLTYCDVFISKIYILPCISHCWGSVLSLSIIQRSFIFGKAVFFFCVKVWVAIRCACAKSKKKKKANRALAKFPVHAANLDQFSEWKNWTTRRKWFRKSIYVMKAVIYQNSSVVKQRVYKEFSGIFLRTDKGTYSWGVKAATILNGK